MTDEALRGGIIQRAVPVEVEIQSGSDGRTVEAYAAVYGRDAEIHDHEGHYLERVAPGAFKRAINRAKPQGSRAHWKTQVYFNHARTALGTASERWQDPVGVTQHIEEDSTGLLTVTRYLETEDGERALALIRGGAVQGQSFTGEIMRSDPMLRNGQRRRPGPDGKLPTVTRTELGLREYGPTPSPAYEDAVILGVRSLDLSELLTRPDSVRALRDLLNAAPDEDSAPPGADSDESLAAVDDSPARRSSLPTDPFQRRLSAALRARGITR
jgi:HK97 family phage prohead protease